jgi:hypothetical protein
MSDRRNVRRQHLARHLCACGERPALEALIAAENGENLDEVLADFGRLPAEIYRSVGGSEFPNQFRIVKGGRK